MLEIKGKIFLVIPFYMSDRALQLLLCHATSVDFAMRRLFAMKSKCNMWCPEELFNQ